MGGSFGKTGSFYLDHQFDDIPLTSRTSSVSTVSGGRDLPPYSKEPPPYDTDPPPPILLETAAEKKARKRSHLVTYATMFIMTVGFSIVLTGVYPYMQSIDESLDKTALGWVVAANPLGQMIASPLLGLLGYKLGSIRLPCIATITCFIVGNAFYSLLNLFDDMGPHSAYYFMIFFRFIVGVSSANVTLCRSYLAQSTTLDERTTGISIIAASQAMGFVIGPAIQAVLALTIPDDIDTGVDWFQWNKYTAAGWVAALLGFINLTLMLPCIFQEYDISKKERQMAKSKTKDNRKVKLEKPSYIGLAGILFAFYIVLFIFVLIETLMTPLVMDQYAWKPDKAMELVGSGLSVGGIISIFGFVAGSHFSKRFNERLVMIIGGLIPTIIGTFLFIPIAGGQIKMQNCTDTEINTTTTYMPMSSTESIFQHVPLLNMHYSVNMLDIATYEGDLPDNCEPGCPVEQEWCEDENKLELPQLIVAFFIICIGYPIANSLSQAIFSKMLGPKPQGIWMGVLTAVGSLSRVTGPIFVSYIYTEFGTTVTFSIMTSAMVLSLIEVSILYTKLEPMSLPKEYTGKY